MKQIAKKLALLAIPLVLYIAFFVAFEPNNYFGLRSGAQSHCRHHTRMSRNGP